MVDTTPYARMVASAPFMQKDKRLLHDFAACADKAYSKKPLTEKINMIESTRKIFTNLAWPTLAIKLSENTADYESIKDRVSPLWAIEIGVLEQGEPHFITKIPFRRPRILGVINFEKYGVQGLLTEDNTFGGKYTLKPAKRGGNPVDSHGDISDVFDGTELIDTVFTDGKKSKFNPEIIRAGRKYIDCIITVPENAHETII